MVLVGPASPRGAATGLAARPHGWRGLDTMQSVGQVGLLLAAHRPGLHALKVDTIGLGAGVADRLREEGWPVVDVNVSLPSAARPGGMPFTNLRAEYWWGLRERLRQGQIGGPLDGRTQAELVGVRYLPPDSTGRTAIESKEAARKRGAKSPNRADALMLAFAPAGGGAGRFAVRYREDAWGRRAEE